MYLEYWHIGILSIWWLASVYFISRSARFDGLAEGAETTIKMLEIQKFIKVSDTGEISAGTKK